ncbi:MAG: methyltransferase [Desulfobacteraceae bacterium]|jgi:tRNA1Val (adenine37-N6)-methyltransferase
MKSSSFPDVKLRRDESIDEFMDGRLRLIQSKRGYRFSVDAILLSEFVSTKPGDLVVDLGTGCGIISLVLLLTRSIGYAIGLELQADLADQARRNAILNGFDHKIGVIQGDIRCPPLAPLIADVVVCNPPYRQERSGRINPDSQRAIARHEIMASLDDLLGAGRRLLKERGRLAMIYPANRLVDALVRMRSFELEPKRIRMIYPAMTAGAKLVLIEASRGGRGGLKIEPPLLDQGDLSIT